METTTFCDVKITEPIENYNFENQEYSFEKGVKVSMPRHTASKFVNTWNLGEYASSPYEVRDDEYDEIAMRTRTETCQVEKSNGEVCGREKPCPYHDE